MTKKLHAARNKWSFYHNKQQGSTALYWSHSPIHPSYAYLCLVEHNPILSMHL